MPACAGILTTAWVQNSHWQSSDSASWSNLLLFICWPPYLTLHCHGHRNNAYYLGHIKAHCDDNKCHKELTQAVSVAVPVQCHQRAWLNISGTWPQCHHLTHWTNTCNSTATTDASMKCNSQVPTSAVSMLQGTALHGNTSHSYKASPAIWDHKVTCHPTQVNESWLYTRNIHYPIYLSRMNRKQSWPWW